MVSLFSVSIFVGAFMLFMVQPLVAKMLLPYYGGAPSVWNACMVFFQVNLLLGYAWSHYLTRRFNLHFQFAIYFIILIGALIVLPIGFDESVSPSLDHQPVLWMLRSLSLKIGLPFFAIASLSPLLQKWFTYSTNPKAKDPYFLYSASNLGSLLALLSYPLVFEALWSSTDLSRFWKNGYFILMALVFLCILFLWNKCPRTSIIKGEDACEGQDSKPVPLHLKTAVFWMVASLAPSALMMSVTNHITTNIAAVPLLWVVPLSLYLLTFVFSFAGKRGVAKSWVYRILPFAILPIAPTIFLPSMVELALIPFHLILLFLLSFACHSKLAQSRPPKTRLTEFYFLMSVGGALGGVFVAIISPFLFNRIIEYPISIFLSLVVLAWFSWGPKNDKKRRWDIFFPILMSLLIGLTFVVLHACKIAGGSAMQLAIVFGPSAIVIFSFKDRPLRFALAYGVLLVAIFIISETGNDRKVYMSRNFFGAKQIIVDHQKSMRFLRHGNTIHGAQFIDVARRREPLTYYHRKGPIGDVFEVVCESRERLRVAVIGLGIGSIASYIGKGSLINFFEIDRDVVDIAYDKQYFNLLNAVSGELEIEVGDGRLLLGKRVDGFYDMIILDAFSSDSIPIHLLTEEAVALYQLKAKDDGILVFHVSNQFINLKPVLSRHAETFSMIGVSKYDRITSDEGISGRLSSDYVVMGKPSSVIIERLRRHEGWKELHFDPSFASWTDKYSNIFGVLKPVDFSIWSMNLNQLNQSGPS